ncbi:unnamed protein product [Dovyalis caffra]|uniref:Uncharacterized protein n=1 Tax=Dovyalis caffra TaxID=77055 RepID=A0AAV1SPW5_9ROSI|nr:unnamed protein product [Dovyalis caffra]
MAQMWLLWWPKNNRKTGGVDTIATTSKMVENIGSTQTCFCGCLTKLLKKLKKRGRVLRAATANRQSSFQCRYDPSSYSLNFDTSGCGSMLDDEDYYQFCAFTSRFVANPPRTRSSHRKYHAVDTKRELFDFLFDGVGYVDMCKVSYHLQSKIINNIDVHMHRNLFIWGDKIP